MINGKLGLMALMLISGTAFADPCTAPLPSSGTTFTGQVRYVGDGDSLCVGPSSDPGTWVEIRVADFYAPELHTPDGPKAKAALERIAMGRTAQCVAGRRSYDRVVAQCSIGGSSVGELMRRAGVVEGGVGGKRSLVWTMHVRFWPIADIRRRPIVAGLSELGEDNGALD